MQEILIHGYTKTKTHKVGQLQNFLVTNNNNNELMIFQNKKKTKNPENQIRANL